MHPFFFGLKRTYLRVTEIGKTLLRRYELTPARFDILRTVQKRGGDIAQHAIVELFGVSRVTVSRMLKALEAQGFIERYRETYDHRIKRVIITKKGKKALGRATPWAATDVPESIAAAIVSSDRHAFPYARFMQRRVERMTDLFVHARRILLDKSTVRYPWLERDVDYNELPNLALVHDYRWVPERPPYCPPRDPLPKPDDLADWEAPALLPMKEFNARFLQKCCGRRTR